MEKWKQKVQKMETVNKKKMKKSRLGWVIASISIIGVSSLVSPLVTLASVSEIPSEVVVSEEKGKNQTPTVLDTSFVESATDGIKIAKQNADNEMMTFQKELEMKIDGSAVFSEENKVELKASLMTSVKKSIDELDKLTDEGAIVSAIENKKIELNQWLKDIEQKELEKQELDKKTDEGTLPSSDEVDTPDKTKVAEAGNVTEVAPENAKVFNKLAAAPKPASSWTYPGNDPYKRTFLSDYGNVSTALSIQQVIGFEVGTNQNDFKVHSTYPEKWTLTKCILLILS